MGARVGQIERGSRVLRPVQNDSGSTSGKARRWAGGVPAWGWLGEPWVPLWGPVGSWSSPDACELLCGALGVVVWCADGCEVGVVVCAALGDGGDVVDFV
jgi:hypothetical protein